MDWDGIIRQVKEYILKYRYMLLLLLCGIFLLSAPTAKTSNKEKTVSFSEVYEKNELQSELEDILSHLSGAGKVKVLLTQAQGEQTLYQYNEINSEDDNALNIRREIVTVTDADRSQKGLVKQVNPPKYLGAIILCQGADKATVRLSIVDAVASVTGLSTNKITVLKMK